MRVGPLGARRRRRARASRSGGPRRGRGERVAAESASARAAESEDGRRSGRNPFTPSPWHNDASLTACASRGRAPVWTPMLGGGCTTRRARGDRALTVYRSFDKEYYDNPRHRGDVPEGRTSLLFDLQERRSSWWTTRRSTTTHRRAKPRPRADSGRSTRRTARRPHAKDLDVVDGRDGERRSWTSAGFLAACSEARTARVAPRLVASNGRDPGRSRRRGPRRAAASTQHGRRHVGSAAAHGFPARRRGRQHPRRRSSRGRDHRARRGRMEVVELQRRSAVHVLRG